MQPDPFAYVTPKADMVSHFDAVAAAIANAYRVVLAHCPESAERTLAVRDLQRARMWANAAISFEGRKTQT